MCLQQMLIVFNFRAQMVEFGINKSHQFLTEFLFEDLASKFDLIITTNPTTCYQELPITPSPPLLQINFCFCNVLLFGLHQETRTTTDLKERQADTQ